MKFKRHGTFYIRRGWLPKGIKQINEIPTLFSNKDINPNDVLGLGTNMVSSLRYWLQATGLTEERRIHGSTEQTLTPFGRIVYDGDRFIEEIGTLALLHYKLASAGMTTKEEWEGENDYQRRILENTWATSWYYFFNEFELTEFSQTDFCKMFKDYLLMLPRETDKGEKDLPADGSILSDFACILNTYLPNERVVDPEDNKECPLYELGLIQPLDKGKKTFRKSIAQNIPTKILAAIIVDRHKENQIKIQTLLNEKSSIGKLFNLDSVSLSECLDKMEKNNLIKVTRTAGLDLINFVQPNYQFEDYIRSYYEEIQN